MKDTVFFLALVAILGSLAIGQCVPPTYDTTITPLPANSQVNITVDSNGGGTTAGSITLTPDFANPAPQFFLGNQPNGTNTATEYVNGITQWNGQNNGSGISFSQGSSTATVNAIVSPTWPKATVSYNDSSGHAHTVTVDFSSLPPFAVAASQPLLDYNSSGQLLSTSVGFVVLINTNGTYAVGSSTFPMWSPTGVNFDSALFQNGEHETGHQFGLGDLQGVAGDVMSGWGTTSSDPTGAINNQNGHASSIINTCDNDAIRNNPNVPWGPPPPPPPPPPDDCNVFGCTCGGTCEKDGHCTYTFDCSPILIAVGTDADIELTSAQDGVWFDIEASGKPMWVGWTQRGEPVAFLAHDANHDGRINDGSELFGNRTLLPNGSVAPNGFAALAAYDRPENGGTGDGVIDARDAIWTELKLWIDWNHNGISEPNELYSLEDWGVKQISLDYESLNRTDQFGNVFRFKAPCQLAGKVRFGYDVYFTARPPKKP